MSLLESLLRCSLLCLEETLHLGCSQDAFEDLLYSLLLLFLLLLLVVMGAGRGKQVGAVATVVVHGAVGSGYCIAAGLPASVQSGSTGHMARLLL